MERFKVGDKIVPIGGVSSCGIFNMWTRDQGAQYMRIAVSNEKEEYYTYGIFDGEGKQLGSCRGCNVNTRNHKLLNNENSKVKVLAKTMTTIKNFVKDMGLSADEKVLRKAGLKTECGDYTQDAIDVVLQDICKKNEAMLVEIAKGVIAEQEK